MSEVQQTASVDACVVIDCNEWIRLKWLGSPIGLTFISALKRDLSLKLAIPEVLGGELDKHRAETARSLLRRLEDASADIKVVTGNPTAAGIITLTEVSIEVTIRERLSAIAGQTIYPDMSIDEVRRALARVNAEAPPNGPKNQQMKDSLLWEACVTLTNDHRVIFVTGDNAFTQAASLKTVWPKISHWNLPSRMDVYRFFRPWKTPCDPSPRRARSDRARLRAFTVKT